VLLKRIIFLYIYDVLEISPRLLVRLLAAILTKKERRVGIRELLESLESTRTKVQQMLILLFVEFFLGVS